MVEYTPDHVGTVTKYVFVESPSMTPGELALRAYEASEGVLIKETCFGLQVTGEPGAVDRLIEVIRSIDPDHIFIKDRGFPPGDSRRCRANLGGARPGYLGHEREFRLLRY
ncbi:MAG: methanogenesis marker protein 6, partial [Methanoculleus sp.]|nr:methanogenesis marker protein 6 [Methanoculleus sp.]